jgi:hypothetical protein
MQISHHFSGDMNAEDPARELLDMIAAVSRTVCTPGKVLDFDESMCVCVYKEESQAGTATPKHVFGSPSRQAAGYLGFTRVPRGFPQSHLPK